MLAANRPGRPWGAGVRERTDAKREDCGMNNGTRLAALTFAGLLLSSVAWAGPKVVSGPGADPECFKPWSDKTKFLQWEKRPGPYKIALANGFVGNTWRIQMIKTAKAFAEEPDIKNTSRSSRSSPPAPTPRRSSARSRTSSIR